MATDSADYCMLVNESAGSITEKSRSLRKKVWPLQTSNSSSHDTCILEKAVYNHWTRLVNWTGGLDWWTDTKNHAFTNGTHALTYRVV